MLGIIIFFVWVILNGKVTTEVVIFGVCISTVLYIFTKWITPKSPKGKWRMTHNPFKILFYLVYVLGEIVAANITTISILLDPHKKISPVLVFFEVDLKTDIAKTMLANSITITPGTLTVSVRDNLFCVHAFDESIAEGIENNGFLKVLRTMEVER